MRKLVALVICAGAVAFGLPHFEATRRISEAWREIFEQGVETLTGKSAVELGQITRTKALEITFTRAVDSYTKLTGRTPQALEDLASEGLLRPEDFVDEWGRSLQFEANRDGVLLRGAGPDGRFNTGDDWTIGR